MKAEEIFEKLGYRCIKSNNSIWYINDSDEENYRSVEFYFCDCTFDAIGNYGDPLMVNVKELEAINKQCEEIGWLEEEQKQETNLERYYDDLLEEGFSDFGVVNGKIESCTFISCKKCEFEGGNCHKNRITWLTSKCKKRKHKFTQFEYDLIDTYRGSNEICKFHNCYQLRRLKEKGYFNDVDKNESIKDILANCEVEG